MNKFAVLVSAAALALVGATSAFAGGHGIGPSGFNNGPAGYSNGAPAGFDNASPNNVKAVYEHGYDDQRVVLTGRLTNYLGHDHYEFADDTGRIEVELDDDKNWSHISKGQLITIFGKVDREYNSVSIDVKRAVPAGQGSMVPAKAPATK